VLAPPLLLLLLLMGLRFQQLARFSSSVLLLTV
jgi:hypothetical protein